MMGFWSAIREQEWSSKYGSSVDRASDIHLDVIGWNPVVASDFENEVLVRFELQLTQGCVVMMNLSGH